MWGHRCYSGKRGRTGGGRRGGGEGKERGRRGAGEDRGGEEKRGRGRERRRIVRYIHTYVCM